MISLHIEGAAQLTWLCRWKAAAVFSLKWNEKSCSGCRRPSETFQFQGEALSSMSSVLLPWLLSVNCSSTGVAFIAPCRCAFSPAASRSKDRQWDDLIFQINLPAASLKWKQVEGSQNLLDIFDTSEPTLSHLTAVIVFTFWTCASTTFTLSWDLIRRNDWLDTIENTRAALWVESWTDQATRISSLDMFCLETGHVDNVHHCLLVGSPTSVKVTLCFSWMSARYSDFFVALQ